MFSIAEYKKYEPSRITGANIDGSKKSVKIVTSNNSLNMSKKPRSLFEIILNYFIPDAVIISAFIYVCHRRAQLRNITLYVILAELLNQR